MIERCCDDRKIRNRGDFDGISGPRRILEVWFIPTRRYYDRKDSFKDFTLDSVILLLYKIIHFLCLY